MALRSDDTLAYYAAAGKDSKIYAIQCASGTMAYADLPPGQYDCFSLDASATEHFRWCYLAPAATLLPAAFPAPTAATSAQTSGVPAAASGAGMAPGSSTVRLVVEADKRLAILYSAAGTVTLYCVKVL